MKPIPKHLRESNRYIGFTIASQKPLTLAAVNQAISASVVSLVGTLGAAKANIQVVKDRFSWPNGVIKTNSASIDVVRASLAFITKIEDQTCAVSSVRTSGQIRNC
ncbi:MAG TPA: Rpp14/Pop5 family protein [Acidobacteriota bacterium]|nr:Rpp14/Pop5 family protein [Acidobacteriota bacterium]